MVTDGVKGCLRLFKLCYSINLVCNWYLRGKLSLDVIIQLAKLSTTRVLGIRNYNKGI